MSSTHTISLSGISEAYLNTQVHQGRVKSKVVQEALEILVETESREADRMARLEAKLDQVLSDLAILKGRV